MNRHWSVSTHLVTDQKTRIIELRRSRLSKRRILLRNDRSTLLDKKDHSTERIERLNPFDLDISQLISLLRSPSENQLTVTIHKRRLNFFEANKFALTIKLSRWPSPSSISSVGSTYTRKTMSRTRIWRIFFGRIFRPISTDGRSWILRWSQHLLLKHFEIFCETETYGCPSMSTLQERYSTLFRKKIPPHGLKKRHPPLKMSKRQCPHHSQRRNSHSNQSINPHRKQIAQSINHHLAQSINPSLTGLNAPTPVHTCMKNTDLFTYIIIDRYTSEMFYDIMIDSRTSVRLIVDYEQYLAFIKNTSIKLNSTKVEAVNVQFEIESTFSIESLTIDISFELVKFHVVKADTFFLLSLADMNRLKVYFNNVENILFMIIKNRSLSVIRRFDHDFLLWKNSYFLHSYITQFFEFNSCYLIDVELRQLHRRFGHSFITKLHNLLERSGHEVKKAVLKKLTKFCTFCQKYAKSSGRFKFILKNDVNFNYSIIVDVMYIENHPILHVVDDVTRFQVARWLQSINARHIWDMLRLCWIDVYLSPSNHILTDADKNFASREFRQFVISMTIITKAMFVEAHWSIDVVKRYHAELRRAYQMIIENLDVSKKIALQMIVKAINDTVDLDDLVLILLIFGAYLRMHVMNFSISSITQRAIAIEKAMTEIKKFRAERQMIDVLNIRNESIVIPIHDLSINSDVLIWRENKKWIDSFKLLVIENETCKIVLSSESIDFRSTVIKSFLIESIDDVESTNDVQSISKIEDIQSSDHQNNLSTATLEITRSPAITRLLAITRSTRARRLSQRYQNFADIIVFLQDDDSDNDSHSNQFECSSSSVLISTFAKSRRKKIIDLLEKRVFELIIIDAVLRDVRIFNFRFVDEIKHSDTSDVYEKFRLVIQAYNDHDKTLMLIQSSTIQRMSQRIILALTACTSDCHLYLRDITQTYVQSKTSLNRQFFIRSSPELNLSKDSILRVIKSLYEMLETETHWFNTYQKHHKNKLSMIESTFDSCLLHIEIEFMHFVVIDIQTDDTLILADDEFVTLEENELARAHLTSKKREKLNLIISIKFNDELIILANDDNDKSLLLTQSKQFDQIRLIDVKISIDLISSRDEVRKMITSKDQYIAQRAKEAYIVIVSQFEASFDLSFAAQTINLKEKDAKRLNQRLQWQLNNLTRELRFVSLNVNQNQLKLMIFIDAAFANTLDLHS